MKKGFTLVEIIAVVVILSMIMVVGSSSIIGTLNERGEDISNAMENIVYQATDGFITFSTDIKIESGNVYCITLKSLVESEYLKSPIIDPITSKELDQEQFVIVEKIDYESKYEIADTCEGTIINYGDTDPVISE